MPLLKAAQSEVLRKAVRRTHPAVAEALEPRRLLAADPSGLSIAVNGTVVPNDSGTTVDLTSSLASGSAKIVVSNVTASPINFSEAIALPGLTISPAIADENSFNSNLTTFTIAGGASQTFTLQAGATPGSYLDPVRFQTDSFDFYEFNLAASISGARQNLPVSQNGQVSVADQIDTSGLQFVGNTNGETYMGLSAAESNLTITLDNVTDNGGFSSTPGLEVQLIKDANSNGILDSSELSGASLLDKQVATGGSNNSFVVQAVPAGAYFVCISPTVTALSNPDTSTATISYSLGITAASITPGITVTAAANGATIQNGQTSASSANITNFGIVQPGASPVVETYTVKNTGNGQLNLSNLQVSGNGFDVESQLPATLAAGAAATFSIGLLSSGSGAQSGTVSFTDNVSGQSPFTFAVSGSVSDVSSPEPIIEVLDAGQQIVNGQSPAISFGSLPVNAAPAARTFTVRNQGAASLTLGTINVPSGFTLNSGISAPIAPGGSATFTVQMNTASAGTPGGSITFTTNDPSASNFSFTLSGTVLAVSSQEGLSITAVTTQKIAASVVGGQKTSAGLELVTLKNISGATLSGSAAVTVFASPVSGSVAGGSLKLGQGNAKVKLKAGQSLVVKIKAAIPAVSANGTFFIVAQATGTGVTPGDTITGTAANPVNILAPFVSLHGPGTGGTLSATPGRPLTFSILLINQGDVTAAGSINLDSLLSTDGTLATATPLATSVQKISIKPSASKLLKVKCALPAASSAGSVTLLVKLQSNGALAGLNLLDGTIVARFSLNVV